MAVQKSRVTPSRRGQRRFGALVAHLAPGAGAGLAQVGGGEHAEDERHAMLRRQHGQPVGHGLADEFEMGRFAAHEATQANHGVHLFVFDDAARAGHCPIG